jgi:hypothetical protein
MFLRRHEQRLGRHQAAASSGAGATRMDGRPRTGVPRWMGESRGRRDGQTLIVETDNFADKSGYWWATSWRASRPTLRMVERFTRIDAETIDYEFTMEDPEMFARPWTAKIPLTTNQAARGVTEGRLYEYACHEGNYSLVNILRGARMKEQAGSTSRSPCPSQPTPENRGRLFRSAAPRGRLRPPSTETVAQCCTRGRISFAL